MKLIYTGDFERLKDFEFEYAEPINKYYYVYIPFFRGVKKGNILSIDKETRQMELLINPFYWDIDYNFKAKNKSLKKLIQAGLVKKEEESNE